MSLEFLSPQLRLPDGVNIVSTTRFGGVSTGVFKGLNLGDHVGDNLDLVMHNRQMLKQGLRLVANPTWLEQVHGTNIVQLSGNSDDRIQADGAYTNADLVVCAVLTADCLPVVLWDTEGQSVMALHAGWRGLAAGIIEKGVSIMKQFGELHAWLGPCIGRRHFEIGAEVKAQLGGDERSYSESLHSNKYFACLSSLAVQRLNDSGVHVIERADLCTFGDRDRFYSHRRDGDGGRMATMIWKSK